MIDLIDRQEAIDRFNVIRPVDPKKDEYTKGIDVGIAMCIVAVKDQPTIQPEKAQLFKQGATSDLISRQQALDIFDDYNVSVENGELEAYSRDRKRLCDLPPIQPEPTDEQVIDYCGKKGYKIVADDLFDLLSKSEPQWIPVSERLPEDYVDVLVWFEYFRYGNYTRMYATHGIGNYSKEYNSWAINRETGWKDLHVFAWMPLPEPYKPNK